MSAMSRRNGGRLTVLASHFPQPSPPPRPDMAHEEEAAMAAADSSDGPTIFDKIVSKEIPSEVVYEDEKVLAFRDISPQAPTHIIIIPKVKDGLTRLLKAEERHVEFMGYLLYIAKLVAKQEGLDSGFRIIINDGPSGCEYAKFMLQTKTTDSVRS